MHKILIVDDEAAMIRGLRDNLEIEGYVVMAAGDGKQAMALIQSHTFDLIILDVMMPIMSGFDVCKATRQLGVQTPIIFLTARSEEIDKVLGLELGADDYITKPFGLELLARIKVWLRRTQHTSAPSHPSKVQIGRLWVDFDQYEAKCDGSQEKMTHKEFELLLFLVKNAGQVVSRFDILEQVWGYESMPTTRTVDNFILKLRQRIEQNPNEPHHILTVHGVGYKLILS